MTLRDEFIRLTSGADKSLARPGRKSYSDQTRDLFNILPTKLNTQPVGLTYANQ